MTTKVQHTPGPWSMHIRNVYGTRDSNEMRGLVGWDFDEVDKPPTPMLRGVLSKAADAKLVERCHEVPHECDIAGCPGPVNLRICNSHADLLAAAEAALQRLEARMNYNGERHEDVAGPLRAAIAKAKPQGEA